MDRNDIHRRERAERKARQRSRLAEIRAMDSAGLFDLRAALNVRNAALRGELADIASELGVIKSELNSRNQPGPDLDVSEHAIVQYLERVVGVDTKAVRRKILASIPTEARRGDKFTVDGVTYVIAGNGRITTVWKEGVPDAPVP